MYTEENKLLNILSESGLDKSMSQYFLDNFSEAFKEVAVWEKKANEIVVNDETDTEAMELAGEGAKTLLKIRTGIEKSRVELKKPFLNGGRLVDHIAGVLTELVKPVEENLTKKWKFIELKKKAIQDAKQKKMIRRMNEEALEQSRLEAERQTKLEEENERLRKENEKALKDKEETEWKAGAAKREANRILAVQKASAEAALKAEQEKAREEKAKAEVEKKELEARLAAQVKCPYCGKSFVPGETVK